MKLNFSLSAILIATIGMPAMAAGPVFFFSATTPYLSTADIPLGFYDGGGPVLLDNLEDGSLHPSLTGSDGSVISNTLGGVRDSVDDDDGLIDGTCGPQTPGRCASWFNGAGNVGATFTFAGNGALPTAFGLVWTDGFGVISFSAVAADGQSLGTFTASGFADGGIGGDTAEDRFFGVHFAGGIRSITISNTSGGIEVDHIQYGQMAPVPEPGSYALMAAGLGVLGFLARRRKPEGARAAVA